MSYQFYFSFAVRVPTFSFGQDNYCQFDFQIPAHAARTHSIRKRASENGGVFSCQKNNERKKRKKNICNRRKEKGCICLAKKLRVKSYQHILVVGL